MTVAAASTANRSLTPFVPPKNSITKKLKPYPQFLIFETGPVHVPIRTKSTGNMKYRLLNNTSLQVAFCKKVGVVPAGDAGDRGDNVLVFPS